MLSQFKFIEHWNKELGIVSQSVEAWKDDVLVFSKEINNGVAKTTEGAFAKIAESSEESKKAFQEAYDVLEYKRKFDLITEEEYYDELAKIRDEHLDKGTKEWFDYTEKIYSYEKQCAEKQKEEIESEQERLLTEAEQLAKNNQTVIS